MLTAFLYAAGFVAGAIVLAVVLGLPSIIYRSTHKSPVKLKSSTSAIIAISYIVLLVVAYIVCSKCQENGISLFADRSMSFPQAFIEAPYKMEFGVFSIFFAALTLGYASNLFVLSFESNEDTSVKVLRFVSAAVYVILIHIVIALFDYLSTMLSLNFFTTAPLCVLLGVPVGFTVFDKTATFMEKRQKAKGKPNVGNGVVLACALGGCLLVKLFDKIALTFKHDRKKFISGTIVTLLVIAAIVFIIVI